MAFERSAADFHPTPERRPCPLSANFAIALRLDEMALEIAHGRELECSLARFGLDRTIGEDLVIGPGRRIAADQARRLLRFFWRLEDRFDSLERRQVARAIDVDRALVLDPKRF